MARLIADRYLTDGSDQGLDLATGRMVALKDLDDPATRPPFAPLVEVLDQGREGAPRWVRLAVGRGAIDELFGRAAADASARGFVPVAVEVYARLHGTVVEVLGGRSLLLLGGGSVPVERARRALIDAAARSPRPHVLLTACGRDDTRGHLVREARAAYRVDRSRSTRLAGIDIDVEQHLKRASRADAFVLEGRHAAAERLLRDVAGALFRRGRMSHGGRLLIQLGCIVLERGRAVDADRLFGDVGVTAATIEDDGLLADARLWQATARIDAGRLTDGEAICRALLAGGALEGGRRAWAHACLARVLLWQGRLSEALELDLSCPDDHGLDDSTVAQLDATDVRRLLASGRIFEAGLRVARPSPGAGNIGRSAAPTIAATAQLRFLIAAGALDLATSRLREILALAREARAPLRAVRARAIWASGLIRAGRLTEARREIRRLERWHPAAPALLQRTFLELKRELEGEAGPVRPAPARLAAGVGESPAVAMIVMAQEEESDREAVQRLAAMAGTALSTSRIEVWSADAGPDSVLLGVGSGLPTRLGSRVLDAGLTLGPEPMDSGLELGVPVRRGSQLIGAFVARWPADRSAPAHSRELLEMTAAIAGPRLEALITSARSAARAAASVPELVGVSRAIQELRAAIERAASAPFAVMIQGESGVGKELVARAIHQLSARRERRFCDINCAALPDDLLESELFGHARGAFTGAASDRPGLFEDADGGTLFLDELADLSARAQAKLLRVLQQQEVRRVGETFSRAVDVRVVAAANREMGAEVAEGRFRQDLLYRLDVVRIRIPPLRERPEDVPILARHFWLAASRRVGTTAQLSHGVLASLSRYHWPGNVRELQNVIAALTVAAPSRGLVRAHLLPAAITGAAVMTATRLADARAQFERRAIESALARAGGSRTAAARELGLSRQGLLKMILRLGLVQAPGR
jgi:DNA-binding NtrC family response regulator